MANFIPTQNNNILMIFTGNDFGGEVTVETQELWSENTTLGEVVFENAKSSFLIIDLIPLTLDAVNAELIALANPDGSGFKVQSLERNLQHNKVYLFQYLVHEFVFPNN